MIAQLPIQSERCFIVSFRYHCVLFVSFIDKDFHTVWLRLLLRSEGLSFCPRIRISQCFRCVFFWPPPLSLVVQVIATFSRPIMWQITATSFTMLPLCLATRAAFELLWQPFHFPLSSFIGPIFIAHL